MGDRAPLVQILIFIILFYGSVFIPSPDPSLFQVRIRIYFQCGFYFGFYLYSISCPRSYFYSFSKLIKSVNTGPDTTTLVTCRDKPLHGNDSMSLVPVRIRNNLVPKYKQCIRYGYSVIELGPYFDPLSEGLLRCFVIGTGLALNLCYACLTLECEKINLNARNCCLLIVIFIFSCIRSHFFPVIGRQQLNYARICCFFWVIPIFSWIRSNLNLFSACLGAAPDTTTLVTLEVQSPGGNDSVSLVQVRCRLLIIIFSFFKYSFNFNSIFISIFIYIIYLLIRNRTFIIKLFLNCIFTVIFIDFNYLFIRNRTFSIKLVFNSFLNSVFIFISIHFIYLFIRNPILVIKIIFNSISICISFYSPDLSGNFYGTVYFSTIYAYYILSYASGKKSLKYSIWTGEEIFTVYITFLAPLILFHFIFLYLSHLIVRTCPVNFAASFISFATGLFHSQQVYFTRNRPISFAKGLFHSKPVYSIATSLFHSQQVYSIRNGFISLATGLSHSQQV